MYQLATIQLNKQDGGGDFGVFVNDVRNWEQVGPGGTLIYYRDNRPPVHVSETATAVQTAINTLWDEYLDSLAPMPRYRIAAYAAGTAYSLTNSSAALDFGTTDPAIVLAQAGTYLIRGRVLLKYNAATFAANRTVTLKFRRTNNTAADLTNGTTTPTTDIITLITGTWLECQMPEVVYTTTNTDDAITIFGDVSAAPSAGSLDCTEAHIITHRID